MLGYKNTDHIWDQYHLYIMPRSHFGALPPDGGPPAGLAAIRRFWQKIEQFHRLVTFKNATA